MKKLFAFLALALSTKAFAGHVVQPLSKKEISDIAAYLASLPGSLVVRK